MTADLQEPGSVVGGRYQIVEFIDEGGMQEVYRAIDLTFERPVAVKVPKNFSAEKRFARSAQASARVTHPNVAKVLDYFEEAGLSYLVEELVHGTNLRKRLEDDFEYLDPHLAAHVVHHLAKGLAASHHAGVFHRDLKPSNIMVSDDPSLASIKITDFGIAKMAEEEIAEGLMGEGEESITGSKTVVGALPYMAPELIDTPKEAGLPADVWALGALLHHLVSGTPPFGTGLQAVKRILEANLPATPELFGKKRLFQPLMDELWKTICACLQADPTDRPSADGLVGMCEKLCYSTADRGLGRVVSFREGTGNWGFESVPNLVGN